ncbi:MAG: hypothetical protein WA322_22175 [Pseudolabrys sp.]
MDNVLVWLLFIALIVAAVLIYVRVTKPEIWNSWKSEKQLPYQGVVKRDWVPTGRIDFATQLNGNEDTQPSEFKLLVEEHRIVESIAGNEHLEIQWRLATLKEAKAVATQYHKYLSEHSLIKSVVDETALLSPRIPAQGHRSDSD